MRRREDVITAFVAGYDVMCRTGALMSPGHYGHGFHATATVGSIGAAAACARLLGLDADTTATAIGIAATMASGSEVDVRHHVQAAACRPRGAERPAGGAARRARVHQPARTRSNARRGSPPRRAWISIPTRP